MTFRLALTPVHIARELRLLREDLARVDEQIHGLTQRAIDARYAAIERSARTEAERLIVWRKALLARVAELEQLSGIPG